MLVTHRASRQQAVGSVFHPPVLVIGLATTRTQGEKSELFLSVADAGKGEPRVRPLSEVDSATENTAQETAPPGIMTDSRGYRPGSGSDFADPPN